MYVYVDVCLCASPPLWVPACLMQRKRSRDARAQWIHIYLWMRKLIYFMRSGSGVYAVRPASLASGVLLHTSLVLV